MQDPELKHFYVSLNGSHVHLAEYNVDGNSILKFKSPDNQTRGTFQNSKEAAKLIVFVPGNPGILGVYHDFLCGLFRTVNSSSSGYKQKIPILAISHNNFDHPDCTDHKTEARVNIDDSEMNFVEQSIAKNYSSDPHHVELQVLNKMIILKRLLRHDIDQCQLTFVGHSIGCYVILRLLQDRTIATSHIGSILIHPALENLARTPEGIVCNKWFSYKLDWLAYAVAFVIDTLLPKPAKLALTRHFCSPDLVQGASHVVIESIAQLVCRKTLSALINMAKSELALIKNMNAETMIGPHTEKLKLIYAIDDHWVNTDNRRILLELYPDLHVEEQPSMHAFVKNPQTVMDYVVKVGMFVRDFVDNSID